MIYCRRSDLKQYLGQSALLDDAIAYALRASEKNLLKGRNDISGDERLYANCFSYTTQPADGLLYESHVDYADLHLVLAGEELIQTASQDRLAVVESRLPDDYIGLQGEMEAQFRMTPNMALLVYPGEAHKVKGMVDKPTEVKKLVIKIRC
ncbi:MAG: DUF386 family protein [Clostridiales bacterium]|nr:DUF386 family protein [Clostridiales bacterium]